jgi:hypothetical protein
MSNSIIVQSIEGFSILNGIINYTPPTGTVPVQSILVISDDNSGSMSTGNRKTYCVQKTQRLIEGCATFNTPCMFTT